MAQVPYSPVPAQTLSPQGLPGYHTPSGLEDAFGANVAQAIGHLGKVTEQAGSELFGRAVAMQQLANETEAREADTQYMMKAGELHAQYSALQGADAVTAYPKYAQDLQDARREIRGSLSNPAAMKMYDANSLSTMGRSIFNGAGHAATQNKQWAINTAKSQIDLDAKATEDNPGDEALFQDKLHRIHQSASELSGLQGFAPGSAPEQDLFMKAKSKAYAQRITGMARHDPSAATEYLDKHRTDLTEDDYAKVDRTVRNEDRSIGSVNIANEVYSAGKGDEVKPGKSLADMEEEVRARAKKFRPDDPVLAQHAVSALRGIWNQDKYATKQEEQANEGIIAEAIRAGVKNEQELRANPKAAAAIDALGEKKKLDIPGMINRYNAARDKTTNEDTETRLRGLSNTDVEEFLNTDLTKEHLSKGDMDKLMDRQQKLKGNPTGDPRVIRAMSWMRGAQGSQLEALGIFARTKENKDEYDHYAGAMQSAIEVWSEAHAGKAPTYKDITEDIGPQVIQQRSEPSWFGLSTKKVPMFQQEVPEDFKNKLTADVVGRGGTEPTDEQVYKAYVRTQFIKLYGGPKGKDQAKAGQ